MLFRSQSERALLDRMIELEGMSDVTGAPLIDADDALRAATDSDPDKALRYLEARAKSNATDAQLGQDLDGSFKVAADGTKYVDQLYDVITLGAGFAGIANELHEQKKNPGGKRLVIGEDNPWLEAQTRLGQPAGESELPVGPGSRMKDTASSADDRYMLAVEHARNVEINRAENGIGVYKRKVLSIEEIPPGETPPVPGANAKVLVQTEDGVIVLYTKRADLAGGPGASRQLTAAEIEPDLYQKLKERKIILEGDQSFGEDSIGENEHVVVHGAGAAGAWAVEAARVNAEKVTWLGRMITPDDGRLNQTEKDYVAHLHGSIALCHQQLDDPSSSDIVKVKARRRLERAMRSLEVFTFERAPGNGNLPRNKIEGAAFDQNVYESNGGNVERTRAMVENVSQNTLEAVTWDETRKKLLIKPAGGDLIEADRLVLTLGQDGKLDGGPAALLKNVPALEPIIDVGGDTHPFPVVVGLESPNGAIRVIGAAATSPSLKGKIAAGPSFAPYDANWVQTNLRAQASHESVPTDSRGVVGSFRHAMEMINALQSEDLVKLAALPEDAQADQLQLAFDEHERQRLRDEAKPVR